MLVQTVPELRKRQPTKKALEGVQDSLKQAPARIVGYRALAVEDEEVSLAENSSRPHSIKQFAQGVMIPFGKECILHNRGNRQTRVLPPVHSFNPVLRLRMMDLCS